MDVHSTAPVKKPLVEGRDMEGKQFQKGGKDWEQGLLPSLVALTLMLPDLWKPVLMLPKSEGTE
jgi:hypothetical protein